MIAVVQRVSDASVSVDQKVCGAIDRGLLVYLGVLTTDSTTDLDYIIRKIAALRIFKDAEDKMNLSVDKVSSKVLIISQFTLCAITTKGNRPSFNNAAPPEEATLMYEKAIDGLKKLNLHVESGIFGADMKVRYTNDGPVTIILDSHDVAK
ncbi:MAG: D-tyrosyl-tRNA(Tyr) deacylase [Spirochaetia bacterium]|nr:D-tyrosyl-tRNA(Tyr) deacylase [Spirochaetia bacterium]